MLENDNIYEEIAIPQSISLMIFLWSFKERRKFNVYLILYIRIKNLNYQILEEGKERSQILLISYSYIELSSVNK